MLGQQRNDSEGQTTPPANALRARRLEGLSALLACVHISLHYISFEFWWKREKKFFSKPLDNQKIFAILHYISNVVVRW